MSDAQKPLNEDGLAPDSAAGTPEALESEHSDASSQASASDAEETPSPVPDPVAAAPISDNRRKVWSDDGDIPFDDGDRRLGEAGEGKPASDEKEGGSETLEIVKTIVFALLIALVLRTLLFQPFTIPSASMEPNLYEGDYIIVSKWSYGYSKFSSGLPVNLPLGDDRLFGRQPERGDIVVFKLPRDDRTDFIKRVVGLPGDRIQVISNRLHINGQPVSNQEVSREAVQDMFGPRETIQLRETLPGGRAYTIQDFGPGNELDDTPVYEVPQGYYFMMGDNRDNSIDSRVDQMNGVGLVPDENLVGRAQIILFSWSPGASLWNPVSWFANLRPSRFFKPLT
jgi:signal peptidase I